MSLELSLEKKRNMRNGVLISFWLVSCSIALYSIQTSKNGPLWRQAKQNNELIEYQSLQILGFININKYYCRESSLTKVEKLVCLFNP